jgi:hypothetical protein
MAENHQRAILDFIRAERVGKPMRNKGEKVKAVGYLRTSSAANCGGDKDSDKSRSWWFRFVCRFQQRDCRYRQRNFECNSRRIRPSICTSNSLWRCQCWCCYGHKYIG